MLNCRGQKVPLSKNSLLFKGKDHVPIFSWLNPLNLLIISQQNVMFCGWMGMAWQVTITTGEVGIYNNEQVINLEGCLHESQFLFVVQYQLSFCGTNYQMLKL